MHVRRLALWAMGLSLASFAAAPRAMAVAVDVTLQQLDRTSNNGGMGTIDLTQGGAALDWLKPLGSNLTFGEKDLSTMLTLTVQGAAFTPGSYADDGFTSTWSGGDSGSVSGSSFQGSNNTAAGLNVGFRVTFTAPDAGSYRVRWNAAGNNTQNWRLTGTSGAASDFQQAANNVGSTIGTGGVDEFIWNVDFTADTAGQVLQLDLLNSTSTNGAIAITGVSVVAVPEPTMIGAVGLVGLAATLRRRRR